MAPAFLTVCLLLAAEDQLLRGQRAFQAGDLATAEQAFRAHLAAYPASAEALSNLAAVLSRREQYPEAISLYTRALKANPKLIPIHFNLAVTQLKAGDPSAAASNLRVFLASYPQEHRARILLGAALVEAGEFTQAIAELEKVPPGDRAVQYSLAVAHARAGDENRATELLSQLPPAAAALTEGLIEYRRGRFPEAQQKFEAVLQIEPNNAPALAALGRLALRENRDPEAIGYLEKALTLAPQDAESTYQLGVLYDRTGRTPDGRRYLEKSLTLRSNYADPHYQLARIDSREKKHIAALAHLQIAAKILPDQEAIRLLLAQTYRALGRPADADREFAIVRKLKQSRVDKSKIELIP